MKRGIIRILIIMFTIGCLLLGTAIIAILLAKCSNESF